MATIKKRSRKIGKMIRIMTGIGLIPAMRIGKMIVKKKLHCDIKEAFPNEFFIDTQFCGDGCCCMNETPFIKGPKGEIRGIKSDYFSLNEDLIKSRFEDFLDIK